MGLCIGPKVASALAMDCHTSLCFHGHPKRSRNRKVALFEPLHLCLAAVLNLRSVCKLDSLRWFSQRCSRTQVLCARCVQWDVLPACMAVSQVLSSCVYSFGSYCVDKQTHSQTHAQTNRSRQKHPTFCTMLHWVSGYSTLMVVMRV